MLIIKLTKGKEAYIDDNMDHLSKFSWAYGKDPKKGYAFRSMKFNGENQTVYLHHCIIGKPFKPFQVDHINGDSLDNRRENLRFVTNRQNGQNRKEHRGEKFKTSKYVGVRLLGKKWTAQMNVKGKSVYLGSFEKEEDASMAYQRATLKLANSK
jgi:hypothetical protein